MIKAQAISAVRYVKALSTGELIKNTFLIYKKHLFSMLIVSGLSTIVTVLATMSGSYGSSLGYISLYLSSAAVLVCSRAILEKPINLGELYGNIFQSNYLGPILVFSLFITPLLIVVFLTENLFVQHFFNALSSFLMIFFSSIVLIEKRKFKAAMKRFFTLLFSNFWKTITKFFASYIVYFVILFLIALILASISGNATSVNSTSETVAPLLIGTLCNPIIYLSAVFLYYDARVRKESFDEELLAEELGYQSGIEMIST